MVRTALISFLLFSSSLSYSQDGYKRAGTFEASAIIAPSEMLNRQESNYYIMGYAEYHLSPSLSFRSDNFLFVDSGSDISFYETGFRSYFGAFYHWQHTNWDKYIGFQPGIAIQQLNPYYEGGKYTFALLEPERTAVSSSFTLTIGTSFYVWKYFNFFANLSYVNSRLGGVSTGPYQTDELIFSAGLGFQINTRKAD